MSWTQIPPTPSVAGNHIDFVTAALGWGAAATVAREEAFAGNANRRRAVSLGNRRRVRVGGAITVTSGVVTWKMGLDYSVNAGSTWADLGPFVVLGTTTATSLVGSWVDIPAAARGDVLIRATGEVGNGANTPTVATFWAEFE